MERGFSEDKNQEISYTHKIISSRKEQSRQREAIMKEIMHFFKQENG